MCHSAERWRAKVCHRDMKSQNVLFDRDLSIKLCDFAFSEFKDRKSMRFESCGGTPAWMPPEVLNGEEYQYSADIYGLGVIVWECLAREEPWKDVNPFAIAFQVRPLYFIGHFHAERTEVAINTRLLHAAGRRGRQAAAAATGLRAVLAGTAAPLLGQPRVQAAGARTADPPRSVGACAEC